MTAEALEEEYRAFVASFRRTLDAAPDATLVVDSKGHIIFANAATEVTLGWRPHDLVGQRIECLVPGRFRTDHELHRSRYAAKPLMRAMGAGRELVAIRRDGTEVPVEISLNPIPTAGGSLVICAVRDISERKRIQQELVDLNAHLEERVAVRTLELEAANRELEMLAYSFAHDLRAPLRAIHGFSMQLVESIEKDLNDHARHCLNVITSRSTQVSSMIDDYLHLMAAGRKPLYLETIDMRALALQAVLLIGEPSEASITLDSMPNVSGDVALILEVWTQLFRNAIKFSASKKPSLIRATAFEDAHSIYFRVEDNGVGFDPVYADKLFRLFERLHSTKDFAGNGIGLCLVKRIVERHGGRVEMTGRVGEGAQVTFSLPRA